MTLSSFNGRPYLLMRWAPRIGRPGTPPIITVASRHCSITSALAESKFRARRDGHFWIARANAPAHRRPS